MTDTTWSWSQRALRASAALIDWWLADLKALLPTPVRRALGEGDQWLLLTLERDEVALTRVHGGGREEVGRYPLKISGGKSGGPLGDLARAREMILCLPDHQALVQRLTLPSAVEGNLHRVLGYTMDHNTPFSAEQVYYDGFVAGRNRDKGVIEVELSLAPRDFVDGILDALKRLGLQPDRVAVGCGAEQPLPTVNLLPPERRPRRFRSRRLVNAGLAILAAFLLAAVVGLPLWEKRLAVRSLEEQLAISGQEAQAAQRLREDIDRFADDAIFLVEKRRATPLVLTVINEITHLLPDDTWLSSLRIRGVEIQLNGSSVASAALIPVLDSSAMFRNVRFLAPVTRDSNADAERFQLSAELTTESAP